MRISAIRLKSCIGSLLAGLSATFFVACGSQSTTIIREIEAPLAGAPANQGASASAESAPPAQGTIDSGGGKVLSCHDGKKWTVELLDLWEGRELQDPPVTPLKSSASVGVQTDLALERLKGMFPNPYELTVGTGDNAVTGADAWLSQLRETTDFFLHEPKYANLLRTHKKRLTMTPDSFEEAIPDGCEVLQAVRYQDSSGRVMLDEDLVSQMDPTNQAALYVHEAVYKVLRDNFGERNSKRARRAVALAFSGHVFPVLSPLPTPRLECYDLYDSHAIGDFNMLSKLSIYLDPKPDPSVGTLFRMRIEMVGGVVFLGETDWLAPLPASRIRTLDDLIGFKSDKYGDDVGGGLPLVSRIDSDLSAILSVRADPAGGPAKFYATIKSSPTPPRTFDARELKCRLVTK